MRNHHQLREMRRARESRSLKLRMFSQHASSRPLWLEQLLSASNPPPQLYAWTPFNLAGSFKHRRQESELDRERRVYVLGVGNVGRLYASYMSKASSPPPITLVVHRKEKLLDWINSPGIEIERAGSVEQNKNFEIEWWTETKPERGLVREVADGSKLRNIIIATKATNALQEADKLRRYLDQTSTVAFAQNGMSKLWPPNGPAYVAHRYPQGNAPNFLHCITTHGIVSEGTFRSRHASPADAAIGPVLLNTSSCLNHHYLIEQVVKAPHLCSKFAPRADLWVLQLEKLIVNALINPLTGILRCRNGALFDDASGVIAQVMDQLLREASQVLQALVLHPSSSPILAVGAAEEEGQARDIPNSLELEKEALLERFSQHQLRAMLYGVGAKVRENTSSMLQDIRAGKATEIRDFNGWIVETAAMMDPTIEVASHSKIIELIERGDKLTQVELGKSVLT